MLDRLLRIQPDNIFALLYSAIIAEQTGNRAVAKSLYESVLRLQPDHPQALDRLKNLNSPPP